MNRHGAAGAPGIVAAVLLLAAATPGWAQANEEPPAAAASGAMRDNATTPLDVASAVAAVRADPNLGGPRTERRLRLKPDDSAKKRRTEPSAPWVIELLRWMSEAGRGLMWLLGAIAVALVLVTAWRWMRVRADAGAGGATAPPPSHVHDLDIRPDSLPDDIAGSARALWRRGEQRAALSLLYRGALSQLVHRHGVAIRSASTEGECVELARAALPAAAAAFFEGLVGAWQIAVYAARWPDEASVSALFDGFDAHFGADRRAPSDTPSDAPGNVAAARAAA
ncbi:MAG TPA: DUF4129 domain-containing protein [Burkholderiaceae bacterium]